MHLSFLKDISYREYIPTISQKKQYRDVKIVLDKIKNCNHKSKWKSPYKVSEKDPRHLMFYPELRKGSINAFLVDSWNKKPICYLLQQDTGDTIAEIVKYQDNVRVGKNGYLCIGHNKTKIIKSALSSEIDEWKKIILHSPKVLSWEEEIETHKDSVYEASSPSTMEDKTESVGISAHRFTHAVTNTGHDFEIKPPTSVSGISSLSEIDETNPKIVKQLPRSKTVTKKPLQQMPSSMGVNKKIDDESHMVTTKVGDSIPCFKIDGNLFKRSHSVYFGATTSRSAPSRRNKYSIRKSGSLEPLKTTDNQTVGVIDASDTAFGPATISCSKPTAQSTIMTQNILQEKPLGNISITRERKREANKGIAKRPLDEKTKAIKIEIRKRLEDDLLQMQNEIRQLTFFSSSS